MSGFSPEWLALREPVDHRSRSAELAARVRNAWAGRGDIRVVDLGCGTGSNLRATALLLPERQHWTLVDYDPRLLSVARATLSTWAERSESDGDGDGDGVVLHKAGKVISVAFRQVDLNGDLDVALGPVAGERGEHGLVDLVTASAFFDLCAPDFIGRFADAVAARRAAFYTVLTYNGDQRWTPAHAIDASMAAAFHAHQKTDKGFGTSAGPQAAHALAEAFRAAGYRVEEGDSPWNLRTADHRLIADLAQGFAGAVRETGAVPADEITAWLAIQRTGAIVGHTDTLAQPKA